MLTWATSCELQIFHVSLRVSKIFSGLLYIPSFDTPPPICMCMRVCLCDFCRFCSNQTERRSVADVRGGVANSSSPPMRHNPVHSRTPPPNPPPSCPLYITLYPPPPLPLPSCQTHNLAANIVLRHDGNTMVDCNVVSFNPDYESIVCD